MLANRLPRIAAARITPPSYSGSPGNAGLSCFGGGCDEFSARRAVYYVVCAHSGVVVTHDYAAVIDRRFFSRHTLWHLRGMARFVRKHPERLLAL